MAGALAAGDFFLEIAAFPAAGALKLLGGDFLGETCLDGDANVFCKAGALWGATGFVVCLVFLIEPAVFVTAKSGGFGGRTEG